jgi:tRNA (guanine37-N1)-methyltransferase
MKFHILSVIPEVFEGYFAASILGRAQDKKHIAVKAYNIRDWSTDRHHKVDDTPYGGGPGMVLKVEPIFRAVKAVKARIRGKKNRTRVIAFGTRGKVFDAAMARRLASYDHLILICGRYEGIDERVIGHIADEEVSIGDFVLSGGEPAAMVVVDAVSRLLPGVLGKTESLEDIKGSFPSYTRPEVFYPEKGKKGWKVPDVLLSGNHKDIEAWRRSFGSAS